MKKNRFLLLTIISLFVFMPIRTNAMQILVKKPSAQNMVIEVESSDTIEALKEKIYQLDNTFLPENQQLIFNGKTLEDGRTLADYNIQKESTVHLIIMINEKCQITLHANGGLFIDKEEYVIEDYYGASELKIPTREGYIFKGFYTERDGGFLLDYYDDLNKIQDGMIFYAHWDKIGIATLDFTKIINGENFTDLEIDLLKILINNETIIPDQSDKTFKNNNGKILVKANEEGNLIPAEGLTSTDNIVYNLSEEDKQMLLDDYEENYVPNIINVIVSEKIESKYKVIFDANEGTFKNGKILTIEKWENGMENSLEKPTRDGYNFLGYFTEKIGGTKLELILAESGIDSDRTFYAKWELDQEVPKTFDNITSSIFVGIISLIGLIGATIYYKKKNKERA